MRKVVAVLILLGLGVLIYFSPNIYNRNEEEIKQEKLFDEVIEEDEILPFAKLNRGALSFSVENLQETPDEIMQFNMMLMKVMYSGDLDDEEIQLLAKVQRSYFHEDLLAINSETAHLKSIVDEVHKAVEGESWIIDYKVLAPEYSPSDRNIVLVKTIIVPNGIDIKEDIYQRYILERVEGLWYIKGWVAIDDITVTDSWDK